MADKVEIGHSVSGATLYFHVRNTNGNIWNSASFESYSSGNWGTYDVAMTEQGSSRVYLADFPAAIPAGLYSVTAYEQAGASPAETDSLIGSASAIWDGSNFVDVSDLKTHGDANWATLAAATVSAAVLATPANKLATDASGNVEVSEASEAELAATISVASRVEMDTNSTQLAAIVEDTSELQGDLEDGGRLDEIFDSILGDTGELQTDWANDGRLDVLIDAIKAQTDDLANGERLDLIFDAIKVVTDRLGNMLVLDGGVYQFTGHALELGPGATADATSANQTQILTNIAALNNPTLAAIAAAVIGTGVDGSLTLAQALTRIVAAVGGKVVRTSESPLVLDFYKDNDTTVAFTLTYQLDASGRVKS